MTNKLKYLLKRSLLKKIQSKAFIIANVILALLLVSIINFDTIATFFGGDFSKEKEIFVLDNTGEFFEAFEINLENVASYSGDITNFKLSLETKKEAEELAETKNILLIVNENKENIIDLEITSEGFIDTILYQSLISAANMTRSVIALNNSDIDPDEMAFIYNTIDVTRTILDETKTIDDEEVESILTIFPMLLLPIFMMIILIVQSIGMEISDEKATRGMEIIISNVSPKTHFFSKVGAANLFVIFQVILMLAYGGIGLGIRSLVGGVAEIPSEFTSEISTLFDQILNSSIMDKLVYIVPLTVILFIGAFLLYSIIAAIASAMAVNVEDYQQIQAPIAFTLVLGFYASIFSGIIKGSILIKVLAFIPFLAPMLVPTLAITGQLTILEVAIAVGILIATIAILLHFGLRIYKVAILNYSNEKIWVRAKKIIKARDDL